MSKFVKSPSFCYITPTAYLDQYASTSRTHLVLAHLVERDEAYARYYASRRLFGDFIMLDNSAYELKEPYSPDRLVELAGKCGAHAIVLPDYPFQPASETIEAAKRFVPIFKQAGYQTFFVPQSERGNLEDWIRAYKWARDNDDIDIIGMSILGIPNALSWCDPSFARVAMAHHLVSSGVFAENKHHHFLGLNAGPALEIPSLLKLGVLDTIDSSAPVWQAILGHTYTDESDSFLSVKKPKMPVQFDYPMTKDAATLARIRHNVTMTDQLFNGKQTSAVWYAAE